MPVNPIRAAQELCDQLDKEMVQRTMDDDVFLEIGELIGGLCDKGLRYGLDTRLAYIERDARDESDHPRGRGGNDPDGGPPEWLEKQIADDLDEEARQFVADARAIIERRQAQREAA